MYVPWNGVLGEQSLPHFAMHRNTTHVVLSRLTNLRCHALVPLQVPRHSITNSLKDLSPGCSKEENFISVFFDLAWVVMFERAGDGGGTTVRGNNWPVARPGYPTLIDA